MSARIAKLVFPNLRKTQVFHSVRVFSSAKPFPSAINHASEVSASSPPIPTEEEARRHPDQDEVEFQKIFLRNEQWVQQKTAEDPEYFAKLSKGQSPKYLFIGCSDSRVPAEVLMDCQPGELFVHRNIANLVVNTDLNCQSVLQYAVEHLKVKYIIVCGHYGCGGVHASTLPSTHGLMCNWIRNIRDVSRLHVEELSKISDPRERERRLVELNVVESCINVRKTSFVQDAKRKTGYPRVRGLVYDIADGRLKNINYDSDKFIKYSDIYRLFETEDEIALNAAGH